MTGQTFCPNCGAPRAPGARFCGSCGQPFEAAAAVSTTGSPQTGPGVSSPPNTAAMAGLAWLITAALTAYLAYEQWSLSQAVVALGISDEGLAGYAGWNAIAAAITLFFGARLLTTPSRKLLDRSAAWAALSVLGGVAQIALSAGSGLFALVTIGSAVAGVLSYVGRQAIPPGPTTAPSSSVVSGWQAASASAAAAQVAPAVTGPQTPPSSGGSKTAERVVIALIVLAVLGGGALLYARMQVQNTLDAVASQPTFTTPRPATARPVTPPPQDASTARIGEAIDLVDTNGDDLGTVTVIKNGKPSELLGSGPTAGYRYIAALVNYTARVSWSYNLFDWAAHDTRQFQYEPLAYAPNPGLSYGTLAAGRQVEGWVAFEVPEDVREVWLDFQTYDGEVIFTVQID